MTTSGIGPVSCNGATAPVSGDTLYLSCIQQTKNEQLAAVNQYTFFGYMGIASALVFANLGAAYGTAKSGVGICSIAVMNHDLIFKSLIPGIMAGILGIYGLIVSVIYLGGINETTIPSDTPKYSPS
jgi:ATP synthase proteolipid subunit